MSITRTTINGNWLALKDALETLGTDFFATVTSPGASGGMTCKDADGNTLLSTTQSVSAVNWNAWRGAGSYLSVNGSLGATSPQYFYKVGSNGAVIELLNHWFVLIAKAKNGKTGIVLPHSTGLATIQPVCWGDDTAFSSPLTFAAASSPMEGNHNLFVPIPLYGTYGESNNIPKAFFMPMSQPQMRGVVQELHGEKGIYVTNGYVALLDDEQEG